MVNDRHASEVDCTWRGRQLGPWPHARKCLLITRKIVIPPPDIRDPPKGPQYFAKKTLPPLTACTHQLYLRTQGSATLLRTKKMNTPLLAGTQYSGRLTCGPTKLTGTEGFVNLVNIHDSSSSHRTMSIQWQWCFFNLWSSCSSRPNQHRSCLVLLPPKAGCDAAEASPPPTTPTAGQAIPLLTHTPCYSAATTTSHRSEPVNPRTPLCVSIHCRVFPGSALSPS